MIEILHGALDDVDVNLALKYMGYVKGFALDETLEKEIEFCRRQTLSAQKLCAVYDVYSVHIDGAIIDMGFATIKSNDLAKNLSGCKKVAVFACTVGAEMDRLIAKYKQIAPSRSLIFQALGSALAERWADEVNNIITTKYGATAPRFSCGYGDLGIEVQRDVFNSLYVQKNLGVTLGESYFMTPTKSITAFVGIKDGK